MKGGLPVDVERLRAEFPDLTDGELRAYVTVTQRVLGEPATRAQTMREILDRSRQAQQKEASGARLSEDEEVLVHYLSALARMQQTTVRRVP